MTDLFDTPEAPMSTELIEREVTPLTLLDNAVREGRSAPELAVLVQLHRDIANDAAKNAFAKAMHLAQQEMPVVVRDSKNSQTGSRYANLESVQQIAKPIYSKHGFSMSFGEADCPLANHKRTIADVTHDAGHTRQYHIDLPVDGVGAKGNAIGGMNPVQGAISTTSYGQRRLCCMVWNITIADEDNDGNGVATYINDKQIVILQELIEEKHINVPAFLKWLGVDTLGNLPARDFEKAVNGIKNVKR